MKKRLMLLMLALGWLVACSGCGGGSGSSETSTTLTGVASKGIVKHGVVRVFEVKADGGKGKLLTETSTDDNGRYLAELGKHAGPVLVEVTGSYADETTGQLMSITDAAPLRAAVGNAVGTVTMSVTPLTEIAVRQVEDAATKKLAISSIDAANMRVGSVFHVSSVLATLPIDATAAVPAAATREQKEYSLALAALSGMMSSSGKDLDGVLNELSSSMVGNTLSVPAASSFQSALNSFASSNRNWTDIRDVTTSGLINVGGSVVKLHLKLVGTSSVAAKGVSVKVTLPDGVTVKAQQGEIDSTSVSSQLPGALFAAHYQQASGSAPGSVTVAVIASDKVPIGELVAISCDVAPGRTVGLEDVVISDKEVVNDAGTVAGLDVVAMVGD